MDLFRWFGRQVANDAAQRTALAVPAAQDLTGRSGTVAVAEQHYVRLWFSELFLQRDTEWFTSRYPLAYSLVAHKYGDQPKVEFANVAGKNKFDIGQADQGRSIMRNYAMSPLVPFRGGDIEVDCGLVSMRAGNVLESFAKTVGDIAGKLNVPQASAVAGIASSVASAVQDLLGAGEARTVLTAHDMFTGAGLTSGYVLLSSEPLAHFAGTKVWVTPDGVRTGPDPDHLAPLPPQDFLVVFIQCVPERDDWQSLGAIGKPLDKAIEAKLAGRDDEAKVLLTQAKVAAMTSPDLTRTDAKRVIAAVSRYFSDQAGITETVALTRPGVESVLGAEETYPHLARAIELLPATDLASLPDPTLESLVR